MRVSSHAITNSGAAAPAGGGPQAAADVDAVFGALLAAALPQADAAAAVPLTSDAVVPATQQDTTTEKAAPGADHELSAISDPSLLALLADARAIATRAAPVRPDADAAAPAESADRLAAPALPTAYAGLTDTLQAPAVDPPAKHMKADATAPATASFPMPQMPTPSRTPAESPSPANTHAASAGPDAQPGIPLPAPGSLPLPAADASAKTAAMHVAAPVTSDRWGQAMGERVLWMAQKEVQSASLTLNPPELGPVKVELQLNDTQAIASFSSAQPEVRKAIEDALPALKTLFADAGLDLRQADVGSGNTPPRDPQHAWNGHAGTARDAKSSAHDPAIDGVHTIALRQSSGLLDTFA